MVFEEAKITPYLIPVVGETLLGSEVARAQVEYAHPEKEANKIFEDYYKEYLITYKKAEEELKEGYELESIKTKAELKVMVLPEITAQIKEGAVVKGTIAGGILLGVGAVKGISKGAKFFGEEIKIVEPKRALQKDKLIKGETQKIIKDEKVLEFQKYEVFGEKRPPLIETKTTRAREFFKIKPLEVKEFPAIKFKQYSYNPLTGKEWVPVKEPQLAIQVETGKKIWNSF